MISQILVPNYQTRVHSFKYWGLLLSLFVISIASSFLSIYIHPLSITITFESIPLLLTGFIFGPVVGAINGALTDLITFPWGGGYEFSFWFFLQPISIGFFGGLRFLLRDLTKEQCLKALYMILIVFNMIYGFFFPSCIPLLLVHLTLFFAIRIFSRKLDEKLLINLLLIFSLLIYVSSFGIGVVGSMFMNKFDSPLSFFTVRAIKEISKLLVFLPISYLALKSKYEIFK